MTPTISNYYQIIDSAGMPRAVKVITGHPNARGRITRWSVQYVSTGNMVQTFTEAKFRKELFEEDFRKLARVAQENSRADKVQRYLIAADLIKNREELVESAPMESC